MPPDTRMRVLLRAMRKRETKTTRVLEQLFQDPSAHHNTEVETKLANSGALDGEDFLEWATKYLMGPGGTDPTLVLSRNELDHFADWPDKEKEKVREVLHDQIADQSNVAIKFKWTVYGGQKSTTVVDEGSPVVVRFRTPETRIRTTGVPDEVTVDVP